MKNSLFLSASLITLVFGQAAFSAEIKMVTKVDAVTVFPGGATISRLGNISLPAGAHTVIIENFPQAIDYNTLRANGSFGAEVTIQSINTSQNNDGPLSSGAIEKLEKEIEKLRLQRAEKSDQLDAAKSQLRLAQEFARQAPRGFTEALAQRENALAEWTNAIAAIEATQIASTGKIRVFNIDVSEIDKQIKDLSKEILELRNKLSPVSVRVDLTSAGATSGSLSLSYQNQRASWSAEYDAILSTNEGADAELELVQLASIAQHSGQDWENISLTLSTTQPARGTSAPELGGILVQERTKELRGGQGRLSKDGFVMNDADDALIMQQMANRTIADNMPVQSRSMTGGLVNERVDQTSLSAGTALATVDNQGFQAEYKIPGRVSIAGDGSSKRLTIARHKVSPELLAVTTPSLQEVAFLHAQIKNETGSSLLGGRMSIQRDGTFMGTSYFAFMAVGETRSLGFGPDDKVAVSYITQDRSIGERGILTSEKTDTRRFRMEITNNHDQKIRIRVVNREPYSESDTIKVTRLPSSTKPSDERVNDIRGLMAWSYEYAPAENREIKLDYQITWPADKDIMFRNPTPIEIQQQQRLNGKNPSPF